MSFAIYEAWCRKAAIRYTNNMYLIAKKRRTPIYLTDEVFEHYKRTRAIDEAFKKKSEQMSTNRRSEVGGPGTGISLHSIGSISARQDGDTLEKKHKRRPTRQEMFRHLHTYGHDGHTFVDQGSAKIDAELTRRVEELSTESPDTPIDVDVVYSEVLPEVKDRIYGIGSQGYHRHISSSIEASSSRGPAYGPHELEELQRDHKRRHVPPTPRPPPSPATARSGPQRDDIRDGVYVVDTQHLTNDRSPSDPHSSSQSTHLDDHHLGHWTDPRRELPEGRQQLLDDREEFMSQLLLPPRPPPL
ncbi:hypothetical protein Scep_001333 [Stephania cephalantha]|uniref:Uncharacterized protein n=1 Tax=Stephania cephalantha TaxID=152367 RepID=A0AAP0L974_9MAGN